MKFRKKIFVGTGGLLAAIAVALFLIFTNRDELIDDGSAA